MEDGELKTGRWKTGSRRSRLPFTGTWRTGSSRIHFPFAGFPFSIFNFLLVLPGLFFSAEASAEPRPVVLWHSYRGAEERALHQVVERFHASRPDLRVELLGLPNEVMASKLTVAIPNGNGPDLFVFAHERIGGWVDAGLLAPVELDPEERAAFLPETLPPLEYRGRVWGLPLAFKSLALFYDKGLVPEPPRTTDDLLELAERFSADGRFALAYEASLFYFHAPWFFGFGGRLFDGDRPRLDSPESLASLAFLERLRARRAIPDEVSGALVARLFAEGRAAMAISGPWFLGEIPAGKAFGVAPLPVVSETGLPAAPFLTAEAVIVSAAARSVDDARAVAGFLAGGEGAALRARVGRQAVAHRATWDDSAIGGDPILAAFRAQLPRSVPMDNRPAMRVVWEPGDLAVRKVLRGEGTPEQAAKAAMRRHAATHRPPPATASPLPYVVLAVAGLVGASGLLLRRVAGLQRRKELGRAARAWSWILPAAVATSVLLFVPLAVGIALSLFDHRAGRWTFVGLTNFVDILAARTYGPTEPLSFYYALAVTLLWTAANLALHVGIGLLLALLLARPLLALRPLYRVLLILPWAVPNYITALLWKGLFHKQLGAINGLLHLVGVEPVAWFGSFGTAFFANLCTNAWLGFPFMMVVCLGSLQAIPRDLYEAASVDGAGRLATFKHVTMPLLWPALVPAVLLGTVWTFNQFNVVYLVSGGEPDSSTDILISEAYRWAFARQEQFGYAAAYAVLIFLLLLGWSAVSTRVAAAAEGAR